MDAMEALVRSLPAEADRIRRQYWRDPEFRTVCRDYADLLDVLARLKRSPADDGLAEQYQRLAAELLAEAAEMIGGKAG